MNQEIDIKNYLVANAITSASSTFVGPVQPAGPTMPHSAVFIQTYGGLMAQGFQDGKGQTDRAVSVQVRVRGAPRSYVATRAQAESIWLGLNRASLGTPYYRCQPMQSSPFYLGQDDQEHEEFTINVRLHSVS